MIGQTLSHFRITAKLGEGGMGAVYLAEDTSLKREVALKILPEHLSSDPDRLARFQREAESLAALNHPNIVAIYSIEEVDGLRFLIMERVAGRSLDELIPDDGIAVEEFFDLALQVVDAMAMAHSHGIVHRDIKPANIMVTDDGSAKVLDLGLAKLLEEPEELDEEAPTLTASPTALGVIMGTIGYMSPEQAEGKPVGPPSDVFSLGALFYEMLTGANPFRRESTASSLAAILHDHPEPLRQSHPDTPGDLQSIVNRCLAKSPEERYEEAGDLKKALETSRARYLKNRSGLRALLRKPVVVVPALALLVAGFVAFVWYRQGAADRQWAREVALPEIERLMGVTLGDTSEAYELAVRAEQYIPDDPRLEELLSRCSLQVTVDSEPVGAEVFVKNYATPEDEWTAIGATPIEGVRLPVGVMRWRFEKPGYESVIAAAATWAIGVGDGGLLSPNRVFRALDEAGTAPPGMVRVAGGTSEVGELGDFFIDRHEVTNRQFKEFVDAGGYRERGFWKHSFEDSDGSISWEEATERFVDETAQPGPATWSAGAYPEGEGDYPVSGVSWYEAAAYAEFVGKALPSGHHWGRARGEGEMLIDFPQLGGYEVFAPFSNFAGREVVEVGSLDGPTSFGAYDMAGNVREWCFNAAPDGALARGGSWKDATYMFSFLGQAPRMDRSPENGFRCAHYPDPSAIPEAAMTAVDPRTQWDVVRTEPVSDEIFAVYKERFAYDKTDLKAVVDVRHEEEHWIRETVSFDAAYGGERVIAHLFLPRNATPPYQTVVYFPGSGSIAQASSVDIDNYWEVPIFVSFLMQNGRAVIYPVYKGTFERQDVSLFTMLQEEEPRRYMEYLTQVVKDVSRSLDYLETRDDIDTDKLAFYGMSWGANLGGITTAIEDRFQTSVLLSGGLAVEFAGEEVSYRAEADPANYAPRIRLPTLMINGRYDLLVPLDLAIQPLYDLLGTPPEHKKLLLYDTDHIPPRNEFIKETLAWLDQYLGPVGG